MAMTESRPTAVTKYFTKTPDTPSYLTNIIMLVLGGAAVIGGLIMGILLAINVGDIGGLSCCLFPGLVIGITLAGMGGLGFVTKRSNYKEVYRLAEPKPSDQQMDIWLEQDKKRIISDAVAKLGLIQEKVLNIDDPLLVVGPKNSAKFRIGQDGIIRFSAYEIVVIYLTDYHLGAYSCGWDFVNGRSTSEQTQEYHYTDVVSVSTLSSNTSFSVVTVDGKNYPLQSHQQFSLSVASAESIKVTVAFPQVKTIFQQGKLLPTGADKAISTLRTMLRDKKGGI